MCVRPGSGTGVACYYENMSFSLPRFSSTPPSSPVFDRVLVTGGSGFIGSHLVKRIRTQFPASQVTVVDNFITGQRSNLASFAQDSNVTLIEHDLTDVDWLRPWLEQENFTLILHFASPASPPRYQAEPILTYRVNSEVTHYLAQAATQMGARMIFASTSEVYGDPLEHPQTESYWGNVNPNGIRSCYDEAKRLGETICGVFAREHQADIRLIRIFNTYGPHMDPFDGRVIPNFCLQALRHEPVSVYGSGEQTRSFCYVDDLVTAIMTYAERDGLEGETINLGNPNEFTMFELLETLQNVVGYELEVNYAALPQDDPQRRRPDISKAQELLGWEPQMQLAQGLHPTVAYFREVLERM